MNRDPIEEEGGINLYQPMQNNPLIYTDKYGNDPYYGQYFPYFGPKLGGSPPPTTPTTTWTAPSCGEGKETKYIQVVSGGNLWDEALQYLGLGFPFVDSFKTQSKNNSPYYPYTIPIVTPGGDSAQFEDTPEWVSSKVNFEVWRVCVACGKIVSVGPCKTWHFMNKKQILEDYPTMRFPSGTFINTVQQYFPNILPPILAPDKVPSLRENLG